MELRFKNGTANKLLVAVRCSCIIMCLCLMVLVIGFFEKDQKVIVLKSLLIFLSILAFVWVIFFFSAYVFCSIVIVTEDEIILKRKKRIILQLNRTEINKCIYWKIFANKDVYLDGGTLSFKMKNHVRIDREIGISYKNVKKLIKMGYDIEIKNEKKNI